MRPATSYKVHRLSREFSRDAVWQRTSCGSVRDPLNMTDIVSQFGATVTPDNAWRDYPRPQLTRDEATTFVSLSGLWEFSLAQALDAPPFGKTLDSTILVPFPLESCLSGAFRWPAYSIWSVYRTLFDAPFPDKASSGRVILHFGAVDWNSTVYVNGELAGQHLGGYSAWSIDVTTFLQPTSNELIVQVYDPNGAGSAPAGKQRYSCLSEPASIWYGSVTGIWSPVWLESVPSYFVSSLRLYGDLSTIYVTVNASSPAVAGTVSVAVSFKGAAVANATGAANEIISIPIADPNLWSPAMPNLYDLEITLTDPGSGAVDVVGSYVGMRTISLGTFAGKTRPALNGKPVFFTGVLDQSWWSDGLYLAPTDAGLKYDLQLAQSMGFNTARVHQKHNMERFYHHADTLGLLVLQDAPGIMVPYNGRFDSDLGKQYWLSGMLEMVNELRNHASILQWNLFNEDSENFLFDTGSNHSGLKDLIALVRATDSTGRLIDLNTGGGLNKFWLADVNDEHTYPVPGATAPNATQYAMDGEYGGMGTFPPGTPEWVAGGCAGYNNYDPQGYVDTFVAYSAKALSYKSDPGLSSIIYTQLTDVETECDGLVNFDRSLKFNSSQIAAIAAANSALINAPIEGGVEVTPAAERRQLPVPPPPRRLGPAPLPPRRIPLPAVTAPPVLDVGAALAAGAGAAPPAGAALWLDASQVSGVADSAPLLEWADLSGGGFNVTASGPGSAPSWHARSNISSSMPSVLFSAASHTNLYNAFFQGWAEQTLLAVFLDHNTQSGCCASIVNSYNGAVSGANGISFGTNTTTNKTVALIDYNGGDVQGATPVHGRPYVASVVYGPSTFLYLNGKLDAQSIASFHAAFSFTVNVGSRNNEGGDRYFDGEVGEIIVYNGQLSEADHAAAVAYLLAKWSIAS